MRLVEVAKFEPIKCPKCGDCMFQFQFPVADKTSNKYVLKKYACCPKDGVMYEVIA